ncbi:MAG TPA: hypothetical protein PKK06_17455 [Phycisphaerae bacterium]|nr:hypothetical protein [Phycisphaerae bacterium]HNU46992.1 hypothetical protein [Phycisphaerae bacterium]
MTDAAGDGVNFLQLIPLKNSAGHGVPSYRRGVALRRRCVVRRPGGCVALRDAGR